MMTPLAPADLMVEVSEGGGALGHFVVARMRVGGQTEAGEAHPGGRLVAGPLLDDAARSKLWEVLAGIDVQGLGCTPGNITRSLEVTARGRTARACSAFGNTPRVDELIDRVAPFLAGARAAFRDTPPPLPPPPALLWIEVQRGQVRYRVAHVAPGLALDEEQRLGTVALDDAGLAAVWQRLVRGGILGELSHEKRGDVFVSGAPYRCAAHATSLRVRIGVGADAVVRHGCEAPADLVDDVARLASPRH